MKNLLSQIRTSLFPPRPYVVVMELGKTMYYESNILDCSSWVADPEFASRMTLVEAHDAQRICELQGLQVKIRREDEL